MLEMPRKGFFYTQKYFEPQRMFWFTALNPDTEVRFYGGLRTGAGRLSQ